MPVATAEEAQDENLRFLLRQRKSRIYFLRKFFEYPVQLTWATLRNFGFWRTLKIAGGYRRSALFPIHPANNLEEFFINRFGRELYRAFLSRIRKRYGECRARRFVRNGARSGSRSFRCGKPWDIL
jgi:hypothetical protein